MDFSSLYNWLHCKVTKMIILNVVKLIQLYVIFVPFHVNIAFD